MRRSLPFVKASSATQKTTGMKLYEIAIFKRFICQHELRRNFIKKYKSSIGLTCNPVSIEQYLTNVEPDNAITSAVKNFVTNEAMGFDFWRSIDVAWKVYLKKMRSSYTVENDDASTMRGYFSVLRENWDKARPHIYDPISVAQLRYGIITPEEAGLTDDDQEEEEATVPDGSPSVEPEEDELDIEFVSFDKTSRAYNGLRSGIISVNVRSHSWKVNVNRNDTKDIKKKQVKFAMVGQTKSGDVVIQFNNNIKGVPILYTSDGYYNINSRQLVENLRRLLSITDDLVYLRCEKVSEKIDSITYKISKQV